MDSRLSSSKYCQRLAISGLGGAGKSTIALEYAYRTRAHHPNRAIFWVTALSLEAFDEAYKEIGEILQIPGIKGKEADVRQLVMRKLSEESSMEWLLIIDNADDHDSFYNWTKDSLHRYVPESTQGSILLTTRDHTVATKFASQNVISLAEMSDVDALDLVTNSLQEKQLSERDSANITKLLTLLVKLPLAIIQATAYMNMTSTSISRYLEIYENSYDDSIELLSRLELEEGYLKIQKPVATTWNISFARIRSRKKLAADYLCFISCIREQNIPFDLLPSASSLLEKEEALGTLKSYGFIKQREGERSYDMHQLVHKATRNWLSNNGELSKHTDRTLKRIAKVFPDGEHETRAIWTLYLPHAIEVVDSSCMSGDKSVSIAKADLLNDIGRCEFSMGQVDKGMERVIQALNLRRDLLGNEHGATLTSMNDLGTALFDQGRYVEAEKMHRETLNLNERVRGKEHIETLKSMGNLGQTLEALGKYLEAEEMHRKTLALQQKTLGKEHPVTLISMNDLGVVLSRQGKHVEAEEMHRETLDLNQRVRGREHTETLNSMSNLGEVFWSLQRYAEAEDMQRKTLALRQRILGKKHPSTLVSMNILGKALIGLERYVEAEEMHRKTLALRQKVLGKEHPVTLISMNDLGVALSLQGKHAEAEEMHRETLDLNQRVRGKEHTDTLKSMSNLGKVLQRLKRYAEAEDMERKTLALRQRVLGKKHPDTISSMKTLAGLLKNQNKHVESNQLYDQLWQFERERSRDHRDRKATFEGPSRTPRNLPLRAAPTTSPSSTKTLSQNDELYVERATHDTRRRRHRSSNTITSVADDPPSRVRRKPKEGWLRSFFGISK
jgi:tetratricopeptide (TPR) repeat protein